MPVPLLVFGKIFFGVHLRDTSTTPPTLVVMDVVGSWSQAGAPTMAARGRTYSIGWFLKIRSINFSSLVSPRMMASLLLLQQSSREPCLYIKLSKTITSWPALKSIGTKTEPIYPAPPVTRILLIEPPW